MKLSLVLITTGTILIGSGIAILGCKSSPAKQPQTPPVEKPKVEPKPKIDSEEEYQLAKKKYPWLTKNIWKHVLYNAKKNNLQYPIVLSLIQSESEGKAWAKGPWVTVNTKKGMITTRAIGLMQIIPEFWYKKGRRKDLEIPEVNIRIGTKIFADRVKARKYNMVVALKDYNSGPGSSFYNRPYINKTLKRYYKHISDLQNPGVEVARSYDDHKAKHSSL